MGQRVASGRVDKELFASGRNGENVHDGVSRTLYLKGVDIVVVVVGGGGCKRSKFRDWNLSVCTEASIFKDLGDLRAKSSVEKGDTTTDFAAQRVVKGVVVWALRAIE